MINIDRANNYAATLSSADIEDIRHVTDFIIRQKALIRWLFPEEIYFLLTVLQVQDMWKDIGRNIVLLSTDPPRYPKSGDLYMYDKRFAVGFRDDGVAWMKKKGAKSKLQETYQSIKIEGVEVISGVYSRAEDNQNFSRRIYRIIEDSDKFVLIHYRDSEKRESAPTGRQDQHPHLIFLLNRIRMEYNNLSISELAMNSGGSNDLFTTTHTVAGILPIAYPHQSSTNNFIRTVISHSQFLNCDANFNQPSSTEPSHGYSRMFITSHQADTVPLLHLDGSDFNAHVPMQTYPGQEINPSDLEFLLDMQSDSDFSHPMKADPFLAITDFSPSTCSDQGGTKILVCLDPKSDLSKISAPGKSFFINFGLAAKTAAEVLTSTVLRCMSPPVEVGSYHLWISDSDENILSLKSSECMDITLSRKLSTMEHLNYQKAKSDHTSKVLVESDCDTFGDHSKSSKSSGFKHARSGISSSSLQLARAPFSSGLSERENKIRIVEKLGYMRSSLMGTRSASSVRGPNSPVAQDMMVSDDEEGVFVTAIVEKNQVSSSNAVKKGPLDSTSGGLGPSQMLNDGETSPPQSKSVACFNAEDGDEWLDENQLAYLSIDELEKEMDKNIMAVVKQMVQLASLDEDLKTEIDSLDSNGFSLLHYCCLYNLTSLIPVLLARGATVNKTSTNGSTPLHLSASAGNLAVCELLIESGASLLQRDSAGFLAKDVAHLSAQQQVSRYLQAVEDRLNLNDFGSRDSSATNVNVMSNLSHSSENATMASSPLHVQNPVPQCDVRLSLPSDSAARVMQLVDSGGEAREAALSNKLLQQAFSSLSLTDKCALSLTLSQQHNSSANLLQSSPIHSSRSQVESSPSTSGKQRSFDFTLGESVHRDSHPSQRLSQHSENSSCVSSSAHDDSDMEIDLDVSLGVGADFDIQSVLSEVDKESLGAAMKMMGNSDLQQIEEEVRKIQNNVRGWLLRKNYINLREAAKVLQMAWREKKKAGSSTTVRLNTPPRISSFQVASDGSLFEEDGSRVRKGLLASSLDAISKSTIADSKELNDSESIALARLQARTRGMLARKSFSSIRKQTMASLVIQKSLIKWWQNKGDSSGNSNEKA